MSERIERAKQAFIHRDFSLAITEYTKAIKELPEDQLFVAFSNRGAALMNTGKVKDAIKCFRKALELNPEHYESMHNMGVAFAAVKQFDKALECFEKTLEYAPYFYASHCGKSESLAALNRFEEAVDAAKDGIQEDPNEPIAHADLGFALLKLERFEEAVKSFERAHALKDRSSETARLHAIALGEYALSLEKAADVERAVEMYRKSIQKHETPSALHNIGVLYFRQKQVNDAKSAFGKALKLEPNFFPANAALGVLHAKEKHYSLAMQYLLKAKELNPNHVETIYNLGIVYMKEGKYDEALNEMKALLKIDQSNQDAKLAIQLLKSVHESSSSANGVPTPSAPSASAAPAPKSKTSRSLSTTKTSSSSSKVPKRSGSMAVRRERSLSRATVTKKRSASKSTVKRAKMKFYTVEELQKNPPPPGVDSSQREMHLFDQDFVELFGMSKDEFRELPYWKQTIEKKRYNLF